MQNWRLGRATTTTTLTNLPVGALDEPVGALDEPEQQAYKSQLLSHS